MSLLPFKELPPAKSRHFVPDKIDLGDWSRIAPLFDRLEVRGTACSTVTDLERWIIDWCELSAALDEESTRRYIAMTCHTDDAQAEKAYLDFVEQIDPQVKPRQFRLEKLLAGHALQASLPRP